MKCKKIISCLNAYVDDELPERRRRTVEAHLAVCESCRGRVEDIRRMDELFRGTLPVPPVPDGLTARIMAEARRRQPVAIPGSPSTLPAWNPLRWIAGLSAPMKLAACATVFLAFVLGMTLDGGNVTRRKMPIEQGKDLYGLEWFAPVPPGSIGSIYIAMADQPYERGSGQ
ncbi:MAG: hypothetical protein GXP49_01230 [Deltaproteobacteria bacterium]|nr:hypothetical protein [Deltaproteobacteria bacterium]